MLLTLTVGDGGIVAFGWVVALGWVVAAFGTGVGVRCSVFAEGVLPLGVGIGDLSPFGGSGVKRSSGGVGVPTTTVSSPGAPTGRSDCSEDGAQPESRTKVPANNAIINPRFSRLILTSSFVSPA